CSRPAAIAHRGGDPFHRLKGLLGAISIALRIPTECDDEHRVRPLASAKSGAYGISRPRDRRRAQHGVEAPARRRSRARDGAASCLITGSLWGQPTWGTWWVWDARLTSVLVLFFLYLGHIALANAFDDPERGGRAAAVLALVGVVNLPIIKFSVEWWNTLHQ